MEIASLEVLLSCWPLCDLKNKKSSNLFILSGEGYYLFEAGVAQWGTSKKLLVFGRKTT